MYFSQNKFRDGISVFLQNHIFENYNWYRFMYDVEAGDRIYNFYPI